MTHDQTFGVGNTVRPLRTHLGHWITRDERNASWDRIGSKQDAL